ncbi:hypothetical protein amrb99_53180 [Actinomadura sp. RB99]|uniref:recombinase family protein n=1 Tax=Actinomadura sp. RB99 TaxID=2691577 RepID=UPI0016850591|nr:recombinase family protein [Actinomadura sp. RB99]MBD2896370.1 hypothetical protein [Actinomadura sp. RB99]
MAQNPQLQLDALEADGYDEMAIEKESGKRGTARAQWEELLTRPIAGDTLKFWKCDRWGRSAGHVLATVTELRERGVRVLSSTENFDLETKEGRFMFAVLAAAAEYELELRAERQAEGSSPPSGARPRGRCCPASSASADPESSAPLNSPPCAAWSAREPPPPKQPEPSRSVDPTAYAALSAR